MPLVSTLLPQALFEDNCREKRMDNLMTQKSNPSPRARWTAVASLATALLLTSFGSVQLAAQAQPETVYSTRDAGVTPPAVLSKTEPVFTPQAREKKISGTVVLSVVISSAGQISEAKVLRSLEESLDENAIAAVKTWSFRPATKDGHPVACKATVEVNFRRS
jgi:TonB family protein